MSDPSTRSSNLITRLVHSRTLTTLFFAGAMAFVVIGLMFTLSACGSADTLFPTSSLPDRVNAAVAADGTPLVLGTDALRTPYHDAFMIVADDCGSMQTSPDASTWLDQHLNSIYATDGEAQALRVAVPLVCPAMTATVKAVTG